MAVGLPLAPFSYTQEETTTDVPKTVEEKDAPASKAEKPLRAAKKAEVEEKGER